MAGVPAGWRLKLKPDDLGVNINLSYSVVAHLIVSLFNVGVMPEAHSYF
jgi:hypothetical protein